MHLLATTGERALVIGASGVLGGLTAKAFEDAGWEVVRASRSGDRTPVCVGDQRAASRLRIDLDRPDTVAPALESVDLVINTVPHSAAVPEGLVIERGGVLINISAQPISFARPLRMTAGHALGTVVLGAGIAPGLTGLVAADLLAAHPDADEVEVVFSFSVAATSGPAGARFVALNMSMRPPREVPLPHPFGTRDCFPFAQDERGWLGEVAESRAVRSYACFAERDVHDAVIAHHDPISVLRAASGSGGRHHGEVSTEPVAHWVCVRRDGSRLAARTIRCRGDYRGAAASTLALAHALGDARARGRLPAGVFGPEGLVDLARLLPYLEPAGITIVEEAV